MKGTESHKRFQELDALRGLAAFAVVLYHYTSRYDRIYGYPGGSPLELHFGKFGVELFFMISGFVIFMSLKKLRPGYPGCLDFAISRFSRLYPAFWAAMGLTFAALSSFYLPGRDVGLAALPANATMIPGILNVPMVDGVYWTLEKELLFYFWMSGVLLFNFLPKIRDVLLVWLSASILVKPVAYVLGLDSSIGCKIIENLLILKWIPYFSSGIIAYLKYQEKELTKRDALLLGMVVVRIAYDNAPMDWAFNVSLVALMYLMACGKLSWLVTRPLLFMGTISYSLYLVHQNIGYIVIRETLPVLHAPWLSWLLALSTSVVLATGITFLIERPAMSAIRQYNRRDNTLPH